MRPLLSRSVPSDACVVVRSHVRQYNLQAIGNAGLMDHALASVRLCWGTQLQVSDGCFLELWSPEWAEALPFGAKVPTRPSYCHPWSSGVTHWLTEAHVGLLPLTPGFGVVLAAPHVSLANPHVGGSRDTLHGQVRLEAHAHTINIVRIRLDTPVEAVVALPTERADVQCRLIGFRPTGTQHIDIPRSLGEVQRDLAVPNDGVTLGSLHRDVAVSLGYSVRMPPGRHTIDAVYDGCAESTTPPAHAAAAPYAPFPEAVWKAHGTFDRSTRGDWTSRYGKAGYMLFGFDKGEDVARLPAWCANISALRHGYPGIQPLARTFHGNSKDNATFLQPPPGQSSTARALGSVGDTCSDGCQGSLIDVNMSRVGQRFTLSVYMVAVAPQTEVPYHAAQLAIRAMDLSTLSAIAKMPLVSDFEGGVYWRLTFDRSIRLRVMPVFGGATVSAVFLDEA
jgi:hypothetical protein